MLPISSTRPSGFVTVDLMDLCDAERFQSCCFGTRPLIEQLPPQQLREGQRPRAELWTAFLTNAVVLLCPPVAATTTSFIPGAKKVSLSGCTHYCEVDCYTLRTMCCCCPCSTAAYRPYCIHTFSVEAAAGELNHLRNFN